MKNISLPMSRGGLRAGAGRPKQSDPEIKPVIKPEIKARPEINDDEGPAPFLNRRSFYTPGRLLPLPRNVSRRGSGPARAIVTPDEPPQGLTRLVHVGPPAA